MDPNAAQENDRVSQPLLLHIVLLAPDPQVTAAWYQAALGAELLPAMDDTPSGAYRLRLGATELLVEGARANELPLPASAQPRLGLDHLVFLVSDLDTLVDKAQRRGARVFDDTDDRSAGQRAATIVGPEGVRIQFIEDPDCASPGGAPHTPKGGTP
jgi:catechol 2,3-dioxygenase-like lactoylglutathione lyase family enzyme